MFSVSTKKNQDINEVAVYQSKGRTINITKLLILGLGLLMLLVVQMVYADELVKGNFITGNTVDIDPESTNSYRFFAPELPATVARMPQINPETGVYVEEVKSNLFYVTDGVYQSAFLKTGDGVIVFDAPPSFA